MTAKAVAEAMGCSANKIFDMEAGRHSASISDLRFLFGHYRVHDEATQERLLGYSRLVREATNKNMRRGSGSRI